MRNEAGFYTAWTQSGRSRIGKNIRMEQDDWDFYRCNVNDNLSSIYTNLSLVNVAPIDQLPLLYWLWIRLRHPDDRGLSTDQEFDDLCNYEDELVSALSGGDDVIFAGRVTGSGRREFYFYSSLNVDFEHRIKAVLSNNPDYQYQIGSKADDNWNQYLDLLYPGEHGLEQIRNRRKQE
jgi:Family of unknown function (DUF695)